jgi:allantoinase
MRNLLIRGGTIVTAEGTRKADILIEDGVIGEIGQDLPGAAEEIDAKDLFLFPGIIDVHVHFNEPGHTEWEGAETGSRALAAGGGTLFCDMPLNSIPCTLSGEDFDTKRAALEAVSITDFALWGGIVPGNVHRMEELAQRGVIGFKAFLCHSGLDEFPRVDDLTLWEGLCEAGRLGLPVAIHAENHELIEAFQRRMASQDRRSIRDFLDSRPVIAELEAIQRALFLAGEAGAKLHIIHISSGRGVALAAEAKARGVDVSIETCPHYLFFTDEDVERLGAVAKCAPPVRDRKEQENLWRELLLGHVDLVASDHSPSSPERKAGDFWKAWGGIAGVQMTLAVLLDCAYHQRGLPMKRIAALLAAEPARRFRFANRGSLEVGAIADIALVDVDAAFTLRAENLLQRHAMSPYVGSSFRGIVKRTIRRGETIFDGGRILARNGGRFVRPFPAVV